MATITAEDIDHQIVEAASRVEDYCECGAPRSQHTYWSDKVYDYNGYRCPRQTWHQDYRFSKALTEERRREARVKIINEALR